MLRRFLINAIRLYQVGVSAWKPATCRFHPTCSEYARQAIEQHGSVKGVGLGVRRICKCHPWGGFGHDPVPGPVEQGR